MYIGRVCLCLLGRCDSPQHRISTGRSRPRRATAGLSWAEVHKRIEKSNGIKRAGARKRFDRLLDAKVIRKKDDKYWRA